MALDTHRLKGILLPISKSCFGLDLGGTLVKISYFEKKHTDDDTEDERTFRLAMQQCISDHKNYGQTGERDIDLEFDSDQLGGHMYLMRFEARRMESFLAMVAKADLHMDARIRVSATGGGARKYSAQLNVCWNVCVCVCVVVVCVYLCVYRI